MEGKTYEKRLRCSKSWALEERRNRQNLINVLKMCKGQSRLKLNEIFTLGNNVRETRGHSWKLVTFWFTFISSPSMVVALCAHLPIGH